MPVLSAASLVHLTSTLLAACGTAPEPNRIVTESLVQANLTGHDSHGVIRLTGYLESIQKGLVDPVAEAEVISAKGAVAVVDGKFGWGQPSFWLATDQVRSLARQSGIAIAAVRHSYHIGRVAPYVESLARDGLVGIAFANASPAVAPFGGTGRVFGTNPLAWAVPRAGGHAPVCLDVATASIAEGKVRFARSKGVDVAPGLLYDKDGDPTTDPNDFYAGGALLAFGGHKGSGVSMLIQFLGFALAGLNPTGISGPRGANGPLVMAIDPAAFGTLDEFIADIETQVGLIRQCPPTAGVEEVLLPGEPELREHARRSAEGVYVPESTWNDLHTLAASYNVSID